MKEKSIEVKVGALVLVCTALLVGFIFVLGDFGGASGFHITVDYPTASDLKPGAPVKIAGVTGGKVDHVEYWGGRMDKSVGRRVTARVFLNIDPEKGRTLHEDAQFYISTQGILGEKYIEVDPGSYDLAVLKPEAHVIGVPPLRMEILAQQLNKVAGAISRILEKNERSIGDVITHVDETVLTAKKTLEDADKLIVENRETVDRALAKLDSASDKAERLVDALQTGVGDGKSIKRSLTHVEHIAKQVDDNTGPVMKDTRAVTKNLRVLSEKLRDQPTTQVMLGDKGHTKVIGVLDKADAAITKVQGAMDDVQSVTANAKTGKGTIGGLLMDNELFMDMKLLLKDLKRHPWKFIWRE